MPGRLRTFFKSFRFKLILGSVLVEVVVLALLVGNSIRLMNHTVEYHAKIMADDFAPLLDGALSLPLFERDHAVLMEVLAKLTKSGKSDLKYIVVFDDQGNVYGKSGEVDAAAIPEVDRSLVNVDHNRVYNARATLLLGGETVGRVRYGISLDRLIEVRSDLLNQGTIIAATGITLTIVLLTLVGVFLTRHIRQLADATRKIAGGDYSTRLHRLSNDEVGELADNFNTMVETVHDRMQRLHDSEQALFQEKERVLVTLHSIGDGVITTDVAGNIQIMNPVAEKLTGWSNAEAEGRPLMEVFNIKNEVTGRALGSPVNKCLESNGVVSLSNNTLLSSRTGMESPIEDSTAPIHNREGGIIGVVLVFHDVSDTRKMVRQMTYQAQHDALTGLANRGEFESRLRLALESAKSESREHAVFYMDLDHFKIVNDTCGHFAGDELLKLLTAELKNKIREADILARLGGDEFGLLLENCPMSRAAQIAENVRVTIKNYRFEWDRKLFEVGVSIGVVAITSASGVMANI
jgi:diguanylate cyclase (GGDEF)-like protein/PAS domain S-box-containing protein